MILSYDTMHVFTKGPFNYCFLAFFALQTFNLLMS